MQKTDREVLELCKVWFKDIMERSEKLTSGNVAHGRAAIRGVANNYAEFVAEHLKERWKPSDEQLETFEYYLDADISNKDREVLFRLYEQLKQL